MGSNDELKGLTFYGRLQGIYSFNKLREKVGEYLKPLLAKEEEEKKAVWSEFSSRPPYNDLSAEQADEIRTYIFSLPAKAGKTSETLHRTAMSWDEKEKQLIAMTIEKTNDMALLEELFQRSQFALQFVIVDLIMLEKVPS